LVFELKFGRLGVGRLRRGSSSVGFITTIGGSRDVLPPELSRQVTLLVDGLVRRDKPAERKG